MKMNYSFCVSYDDEFRWFGSRHAAETFLCTQVPAAAAVGARIAEGSPCYGCWRPLGDWGYCDACDNEW